MPTLLNLSIEPARRVFEVTVAMGAHSTVCRHLRVLADTPGGAARIVRQRYPLARGAKVRCCPEAPPEPL
jgi:hypothetical protein